MNALFWIWQQPTGDICLEQSAHQDNSSWQAMHARAPFMVLTLPNGELIHSQDIPL